MADLLIENVPDELCCAYQSMSDEERRLVMFELTAIVRRISCKRPEVDVDIAGRALCDRPSIEEIRAFRESLNVPPLTEEFLERAINEGRV